MVRKQEWVIDIEYINAADKMIVSTLIFKDEYMNI